LVNTFPLQKTWTQQQKSCVFLASGPCDFVRIMVTSLNLLSFNSILSSGKHSIKSGE
jgi:hypothetical protein